MKKTPENTNQVSTEHQRLALEAMTHELIQKLNLMVAEQEARSREFAAQQHSLSPTPVQPTPQTTQRLQPAPPDSQHRTQTPVVRPVVPQPPTYTPEPEQELPPPPQYFPPIPETPKPTIIRKNKKEEEGIGATTIIIFIVVLVLILSKGCS